ncbi:MAG: hypothetical protein AAFO77_05005, partial [Pseudomonadota bacterium]
MGRTATNVGNRVRLGYCSAIIVIAALAIASLLLVDRANSDIRDVSALTDLIADQQTLSQRVVLLSNLAHFE